MYRKLSNLIAIIFVAAVAASAQAKDQQPKEYEALLATLGKTGDYKDGVLKVNLPRNDLAVTIRGRSVPTPLGFGGWVALTKADDGSEVMMGDLVLTDTLPEAIMKDPTALAV